MSLIQKRRQPIKHPFRVTKLVVRISACRWFRNDDSRNRFKHPLRVINIGVRISACRWFRNNDNKSNTQSGLSNWLSEFQHVVDLETTTTSQTPNPGYQIGCPNFSMSLIQKQRPQRDYLKHPHSNPIPIFIVFHGQKRTSIPCHVATSEDF